MIKINLAPLDELESPYWYAPDLATLALFGLIGYFVASSFLSGIQMETEELRQQTASFTENNNRLAPELTRFDTLGKEISELNTRVEALKKITESRISRYHPIIVLEHLQNLKPEGIWFRTVTLSGGNQIKLIAKGLDNLQIADFITALLSTKGQALDVSDLRSQVFFDSMRLEHTRIESGQKFAMAASGDGEITTRNIDALYSNYPEFELNMQYVERNEVGAGAAAKPPVADSRNSIFKWNLDRRNL